MTPSDIWVCDLETDGFADVATVIWCIAARNLGTRQERFFAPEEIPEGLEFLSQCAATVWHNGLGFDALVLERLHGLTLTNMEDSLILSRLYQPDRPGGHSIEAWGERFGVPKPVHEDWTQYSAAMGHRCVEDVRIGTRVVQQLLQEGQGCDWSDAIATEYSTQLLQNRIEARGILLDVAGAEALRDKLTDRMAAIETEMVEYVPPTPHAKGVEVSRPWKVDGTLSKAVTDWVDDTDAVCGPFTRVEWRPLNFQSPKQVQSFLLGLGWVPTDFNYKTAARGGFEKNRDGSYVISSPKVTEDSLVELTSPAAELFKERRVMPHRLGLVSRVNQKTGKLGGWLNEVRDDGRVEAQAIPLGTNTGRYTHRQIVNIPGVGTLYGEELRSLLIATPGHIMVGTDASGLEARVAGHLAAEFDGGRYAHDVLEGDIHTANAEAFSKEADSVISRSLAKTIGYALMFGATGTKVSSQAGVPVPVGNAMVEAFWKNMPGLAAVRDRAMDAARKRGYVVSVDGRRIYIRSPHSALNALIQSSGAIIMKNAFLHVAKADAPWYPLLTMHDEMLCEMEEQYVEPHCAVWQEAGEVVTEKFQMRVPITFESKAGASYAACH